jgi:hypothetical protein
MDYQYETIPLVDNNNEPFNLNELMRFNREDYNHNTQNKVQNDEKEEKVLKSMYKKILQLENITLR